jgi:hypothetical protein
MPRFRTGQIATIPRVVRVIVLSFCLLGVGVASALRTDWGAAFAGFVWLKLIGGYTIEDRVRMHVDDVAIRLEPKFAAAGLGYPPVHLAYVAFKDEKRLEVYARETESAAWRKVVEYPILGMSGSLGPKLREGDMQVPEGIYRAEFLNPNSRFHLSIRLDYPNDFDAARARAESRTDLGSDIMIHGTSASVGCLAVGNQAAEDLFILAALVGKDQVTILISPTDFRRGDAAVPVTSPSWLPELYREIAAGLRHFPVGS